MIKNKGRFTLPGESGYEGLTLRLAEKWGADVIRDSDGTELSPEIIQAGYGIYSTICIIRDHNEWARQNRDKLQQTFLCTSPQMAESDVLAVSLMDDFFSEQFEVNASDDAVKYWQVYDRTEGKEVPAREWGYVSAKKAVLIHHPIPYHFYTVSFLAYRIWEEINMYNGMTNHWTSEHLMPVDPIYPETRQFLIEWLDNWCREHPATTVVRFTSLFYNFAWIWGSNERNRSLFTDWASYDFTVSPLALDRFRKKYGYSLTAEDFINKGNLQVTHMPATKAKRDWMAFVNDFVISFGKQLVDLVHSYGKKAYVFYDDSWVGIEPWGDRFEEFGFDGIIKCVFSGYEARLCSGVKTETHEIRLHPYLFPVGLGGAPTFAEGGHPTRDAQQYWLQVRRGLLRAPIQRIGLGGYLHLTENFPDFQDYIEKISDEFRRIESCHASGEPYVLRPRIAVLHYWGKLRSWTLSGHFHETYMHDLIHVNEALAGLPFDVDFIDFDDVRNGCLHKYNAVINAGKAGDAWSGGDTWKEPEIIAKLTEWVYQGGAFIGINEPSAVKGYDHFLRLADILGVDEDTGARVCHGRWKFEDDTAEAERLIPSGSSIVHREGRFLTDGRSVVLKSHDGIPDITINRFGKGSGVYMGGFTYSLMNTRMLLNIIIRACGEDPEKQLFLTDNPLTDCAFFANSRKLVIVNNSDQIQETSIKTDGKTVNMRMDPFEEKEIDL